MVDFLMMFSLCICVLSGVTLLIVHIWSKKKQKKEEAEDKTGGTVFHSGTRNVPKPIKERAGILQVLAPDGANTMPVSYMILDDNGIELYYAGLYIDKLPVEGRFAHSFAGIFNMDYVESTVIIDPLLEESQKKINRRIRSLDMERSGERDRNRLRVLDGKIADAERWARQIDSDQSTLFETYFLFLIRAESLKLLTERISEFISRGKGIGFRSCYAMHKEAFFTSLPLNEIFEAKISVGKNLSVSKKPIKGHILSQAYLSLIFNHTTSEYFHEKGCVFGRSIYSGMPVTFDPFDKTHFSYGAVIAGQSGYGKSATVKQLFSRQVDFGVHIANIDYEPLPGDGKRGEYSIVAEAVGGVNYLISNYSDSQLNFFEISDEYEYNRATGEEIPTLYLEEKIVDMTNILMVLATSFTTNGMVGEFEPTEYSRIKSIISKNVRKIYADCGLRDKDAASLYETVPASGGSFGSGRRKKRLPQMHDFYRAILLDARENKDSFKENAFSLLLDIFEDRVREMYYCPHCMKEFTREELSTLKRTERGAHICNNHEEGKIYYLREIHGSQAYLDCQSTLSINMSLPFHNFDLSQITDETERINMIMVVQSYIEENFIKKNSTNPNKARKLIVSTDEAHRILKFEGARMFENALYRVARKRHTAPWLILQSVKDFAKYQDTEEILKSTETFMLFRHNYLDGQYIKDTTNLTQSQVDTVLNLGGTSEAKKYGELCLVDIPTKRAVFIQADYLKDSEFDVVETDVEKIAEHARMKQGA